MKILLGNNTLSIYAGSETWTYTLAVALKRAGHDVSCFSPELGDIANDLKVEGIRCFSSIPVGEIRPFSIILDDSISQDYDFIIANHWHIVEYLRKCFPKTPIISTVHGVIHTMPDGSHAPEHPSMNGGVNQFISVSEEVQEVLKAEYNIESLLIRNFIDTKKYKKTKVHKKPEQLFINSNYLLADSEEVNVIREVAKHYGARLAAAGIGFGNPSKDILKAVKDSDVVFGYGRSILEALACGKLAIVHGHRDTGTEMNRGTGGVITEESVDELRSVNFSGRNAQGVVWDAEKFIKEIDTHYKKSTFEWGPDYVAKNHNAVFAAQQFVELGKSLLGQKSTRDESTPRPLKRAKNNPGIYAK